ncbi:leukotriene A-4 hydrolase-like isoform X2 [Crassostrea angulata]|uniref:leukotriene A-4 hydrolase-like isoform X2 n=1 Tax=Magallana angulata TaxID=2784310 RepID=UPI0022B19975|nr:leukotriene A-4 hydrolase-like isoform X2 [Crassostrea angulata]
MTDMNPDDSASFSRPDECRVTSLHLNLDVDFVSRTLCGFVDLAVKRMKDGVHNLILDAQMITVQKILDVDYGQELKFTLGENSAIFGSKLEVQLPVSASKCHKIRVHYETSPQCPALQWLRPEQTLGKRHPYLFSQSQAIHARSLFPCQDTPGNKVSYTAKITAPKDITILMSAIRSEPEPHPSDGGKLVYQFEQKFPVCTYLIAIVGGDLVSSIIGPRSKVWTEREMIEEAAYEFSETEKTLQIAESLMGPYIWGQYDVLVLPPIFPFGGMENPCLTYVTPTLIAGDKSLVDILAHEICHSWTGNLVTNKNWEHFWLNEGHTEFIERKVTGRLHNSNTLPQFMAAGKAVELKEIIEEVLKNGPYTRMIPDLKGVDPNDAFCIVPYEKGFTLLFYLETLLGGPEVFEKFLRAYIENFKQQSIDTNQWKDFLYSYFHDKTEVLDSVEWEKWFYGQGMPPVMPKYDDSFSVPCKQLCQRWSTSADNDLDQFDPSDLTSMAPLQVVECLGLLVEDPPLSLIKIQKMNELYKLNVTKNSEFKFRWLRLCIKAQWKESIPKVLDFVNEQGRMRLVRTLYRDLYGWEDARPTAIDNFKKQRGEMHHILETMLSSDLKLG